MPLSEIDYFLSGLPLFETSRLRVRRWRPADDDALFAVYSDEEGARWVGDGQPITEQECQLWLRVTSENYKQRGYGMFAIDALQTNQVIGFCGIVHPGGQTEPEIKYAFLKQHWGQGMASEVVPALLTYSARTFGLHRIIATVAPENLASQRVLHKAGMARLEARMDEHGARELVYEWLAES